MTPTTSARLRALGLTSREFATLTGISEHTVSGWGGTRHRRGIQHEPLWVSRLLDAWEAAPVALQTAPNPTPAPTPAGKTLNAA